MFSLVKRLNSRVSIFCRPHSLTMSSFAAKINEEISKYDVMIFSKSYCPYCIKAKDAIKKQNVSYGVLELDVVLCLINYFFPVFLFYFLSFIEYL